MFNVFNSWKSISTLWAIVEPLILKLAMEKVPTHIQKLYENVIKMLTPCINSLLKLKVKIKETPNATDDYCFQVGVGILKQMHNWLGEQIETLEK